MLLSYRRNRASGTVLKWRIETSRTAVVKLKKTRWLFQLGATGVSSRFSSSVIKYQGRQRRSMGKQQRVALRRSPAQGYGRLVRSRRAVRALDRTPQEPLEGLPRRRRGFCFLDNLSEVRMLTTFEFAKSDHQWVSSGTQL